MRSVEVPSLGDPGTFTIPEGCPCPNTERFSYECSKLFYMLNQEGFVLEQAESTELDSVGSDLATLTDGFSDWLDSVIDNQNRGLEVEKYVPPALTGEGGVLPGLLAAILSGNWAVALVYLAQYAIQLMISRLFEDKVEHGSSVNLDVSALVTAIQDGLSNSDSSKAFLLELRETLENLMSGFRLKAEVGGQEVYVGLNGMEVGS